MNVHASSSASFTMHDALEMSAIASGEPELLTPSAPLDIPVRWAHVIGVPNPGNMLYGGEIVLSTLAGIDENHPHPSGALVDLLRDLDQVGAAALMVEVLPHRTHLVEAVRRVAAERELKEPEKLPIFLFRREVRFVRITESVQRDLMVSDLEIHSETLRLRDPLGRATTNLFEDLASSIGLTSREASDRAVALGLPSSAGAPDARGVEPRTVGDRITESRAGAGFLTVLVFRVDSSRNVTNQHMQVLATLLRAASHKLRLPALIGNFSGTELAVLLSQNAPERFCLAVREEAARRRSYETVPNYTVGLGTVGGREQATWEEIPVISASASAVAEAASRIAGRRADGTRIEVPDHVREQGLWRVADLGLAGLLAQLLPSAGATAPRSDWFVDHYLAVFQGEEGAEIRALVQAFLAIGENKTELARELNISRPTLYGRIQRCEEALGAPLNGETLAILHAVLVLEKLAGASQG